MRKDELKKLDKIGAVRYAAKQLEGPGLAHLTSSGRGLPRNLLVLDGETSGLVPKDKDSGRWPGLLEVGAVRWDGAVFYCRIAIERGCMIEQPALDVNGIDAADLGKGASLDDVYTALVEWLAVGLADAPFEKYVLVARNPGFDLDFLRKWMPDVAGMFHRRTLDLHSATMLRVCGDSEWTNEFIEGLLDGQVDRLYGESMNLKPEPKPHHALRGAIHEWESLRRLRGLFGWSNGALEGVLEDMEPDFRRDERLPFTPEAAWLHTKAELAELAENSAKGEA